MNGYRFTVSCPSCGGEPCDVATGVPVDGTSAAAVFACRACGREWSLLVTLRRVAKPESQRRARYRPARQDEWARA